MFAAISKVFQFGAASRIEAIARQVAEQSTDEVSQLVGERVQGMCLAEARGYVQARAARTVLRNARVALSSEQGLSSSSLEEVVRLSVVQLVPRVLRQASVGVPLSLTTPRLAA